ncbi:MAG: hypothetical protein GYB31_05840 [Bacteroidetes bacterium]|nr:hypothetical protein [Bacteroidota bacterium]
MSKSYLHRIIDSFSREFAKRDEEDARETIIKNIEELTDSNRIAKILKPEGPYSERILISTILEVIINRPENLATEIEIFDEVVHFEKEILRFAKDEDFLKYEDHNNLEILRAVLEVALEDDSVSKEEIKLISRLRKKLKISERNGRVVLAQLKNYPQKGNQIHSLSQVKDAIKGLQKKGIIFYCNAINGGTCVIPDEIIDAVKKSVGIELNNSGFEKLIAALSKDQLSTILENENLPKSGVKVDLQQRLIQTGIQPSVALDYLSTDDLYNICSSLPGVKVSGTKNERIERIIAHFDSLLTRDVSEEASPGELYYEYLVELATRDRENLLVNNVISKDIDMNNAFEEGTRFLFKEKLGFNLVEMEGNENPDGCIKFPNGQLFMWDNKSKETDYSFPGNHVRQFKRYIRDSIERVSCFLVIVPKVKNEAARVAKKLKVESGSDTDIAIITAEDLKWLADGWSAKKNNGKFNLHVFNYTGILTRPELEDQMDTFL